VPGFQPLEIVKSGAQTGGRELGEKDTGLPRENALEGTAAAVGDDGRPAGLGLQGCNPEILFTGKQQRFRSLVKGPEVQTRDLTEKGDIRAGRFLELSEVGAGADDR
jgi:hypothetical protein